MLRQMRPWKDKRVEVGRQKDSVKESKLPDLSIPSEGELIYYLTIISHTNRHKK